MTLNKEECSFSCLRYMYVRKKKISPFVIGAKCHGFAKAEDIFQEKQPAPQEPYRVVSGFGEGLIDAETGKPISISKASWNATEGRIDLDTSTILAMGTGRLNIKNRVQPQTASEPVSEPSTPLHGETIAPFSRTQETVRSGLQSRASETEMGSPLAHSGPPSRQLQSANTASTVTSRAGTAEPTHFLFSSAPNARQTSWNGLLVTESRAVTAESVDPKLWSAPGTPANRVRINSLTVENLSPTRSSGPSEHKRHPLISQFLKTGPLTPMMHVNWDARSNTVISTDEKGNRIEFAEDGVDYSSDDCSDGGDSTNDDRQSVASSAVSKDSSAYAGSTLGSLVTGLHARNWRRRRAGSVSSQHSSASGSTMTKRSTRSTASQRSREFKRDTTIGIVGDSISKCPYCVVAVVLVRHVGFHSVKCHVVIIALSLTLFPGV